MLRSEEIADLAAALSKAQAEMRAAEQDRDNTYFRSKYATLDSVWNACREPLTKHGLAVVQTTEPTEDPSLLTVVTTLLHSSGQWISSPLTMPVVKPEKKDGPPGAAGRIDPQAVGSCITYARRYGLAAMVGVAPDEDDDGNAASQKAPQAQQAPRQGRPVQERVTQATERQQSYAGATGAAKEDPERAKARTAFFGVYSSHFGRTSDEQRHAIINSLLMERHKAPVETWDDWTAVHYQQAARMVEAHAAGCPGGAECGLLHPEREPEEPTADEPAAPEPDAQAPTPNGAAPAAGAAVCSVETCGKPLTRPQMQVSRQQFGRNLCPSCQKEAKAEAAG